MGADLAAGGAGRRPGGSPAGRAPWFPGRDPTPRPSPGWSPPPPQPSAAGDRGRRGVVGGGGAGADPSPSIRDICFKRWGQGGGRLLPGSRSPRQRPAPPRRLLASEQMAGAGARARAQTAGLTCYHTHEIPGGRGARKQPPPLPPPGPSDLSPSGRLRPAPRRRLGSQRPPARPPNDPPPPEEVGGRAGRARGDLFTCKYENWPPGKAFSLLIFISRKPDVAKPGASCWTRRLPSGARKEK